MTRTLGFALAAVLVPSIATADITMMDHPQKAQTGSVVVVDHNSAPADDVVYDDWNPPVFTSGAVLFLGTWAASAIVADTTDHPGADRLYVPLVGPWLALSDWGNCPIANPQCDNNTTDKVLLIADGIFQAAGVLTMIDSLVYPASHHRTAVVADKKVHIVPTGTGFAALGHF
jgi:hypothetical protein